MGRLVYNFASAIATATLVASVIFGCSQTVVPSEEDIQLAEEQQRILEHSSSSKKKSSAQSSSSQKTAAVSSSSAERLSSAEQSSNSKAKSSNSAQSRSSATVATSSNSLESILEAVTESVAYTTRDSVAAYLCKFDKLPHNYIGKNEGQKLYETLGNTFSKWNFNPWTTLGVMIGGDTFNNFANNAGSYHKTLPEGNYHEADVDYSGKKRGSNRLVYQPDCVIYYTVDHYKTFVKMNFDF